MTLDELTRKLDHAGAVVADKRLKIDFGLDGAIMLDGMAGRVFNAADEAADTVVSISWADWMAVAAGTLDPMSAYMKGRLRIQGEMGPAMQLQALFAKLRSNGR